MKILLPFLVVVSFSAQAFTLNNNFGAAFKKNKVNVYVATDTHCAQAGITVSELAELVKPAVDQFWNTVPTSSLRLNAAGFAAAVGNDINTDRLCAPTDNACITSGASIIPPVNDILIACNSNDANFGGPGSDNVLAVTVPNSFSGRKIAGAVILINNFGTVFSTLSQADKISVIAHEIGHAIGLGHAEESHSEALMYYKTVNLRRSLAQDDVDGVSYLYPLKMDGCGLFGGTIVAAGGASGDPKDPPFWQLMLVGMILSIMIFELVKLFHRPKASSPA